MQDIKIKKEFWDKIVSGEKKYEFRKLSKGLDTGIYEFYDLEKYIEKDAIECSGFDEHDQYHYEEQISSSWATIRCSHCEENTNKSLGTAKLRPIAVNPQISGHGSKYRFYTSINNNLGYSEMVVIDKETYEFVKENYIDKGIDFTAHEISEEK